MVAGVCESTDTETAFDAEADELVGDLWPVKRDAVGADDYLHACVLQDLCDGKGMLPVAVPRQQGTPAGQLIARH